LICKFIFFFLREIYIERKVKFYYNSLKKEDLLEEWPVNTLLKLSNQSKSYLIDDLFKQVIYLNIHDVTRRTYIFL
jgi:hypothetical protein